MAHTGSPEKAILYAFLANFGIAISKGVAAVYTNSGSMAAEAIHSVADTCNQVLLYIGLRSSKRGADEEHPLGYGKLSYFWSFIVALILFSLGGIYSLVEGWHKLTEPEPLKEVWVGLLVLGGAILLEGGSLYGAVTEAKKMAGEKPFWQWLKTTRSAEIVVVLGEDVAAILGLLMAWCALLAAWWLDDVRYDAFGSIAIGVLLIVVAVGLANRLQGLLVGRSAEPDLRATIEELIQNHASVSDINSVVTLQMGPKVLLAAKVSLDPTLLVSDAAQVLDHIESAIKSRFQEIEWCFIEIEKSNLSLP